MASETVSTESSTDKTLRRSKRERHSRLDLSVNSGEPTESKKTIVKTKTIKVPTELHDDQADLYQPGDIVWCKLGNFPWWPALVCNCHAEGGIHTKLINSNNKPKRQFFVYFYGKYLEYSWISTKWLLKYEGLHNFIVHAESEVQKASKKSEQQELANRYQLKVSMKKRLQWDEARELADRALSLTNEERVKVFDDLLEDVKDTKDQSKTIERHNKNSTESMTEKQKSRNSSTSEKDASITTIVTRRKPKAFLEETGESNKKRSKSRSGQSVSEKTNDSVSSTSNENPAKRRRVTPSSESMPSTRSNQQIISTNAIEIEYEYPSSTVADSTTSAMVRFVMSNNPPLSNFEQKQLAEALMKHPKGDALTLDEAQSFINEKATDIVFENHHHRMTTVSPEWFYDAILLRYPSVAFHYHSWFDQVDTDVIPNASDVVQLKQWQVALMIRAKAKADQISGDNKNQLNIQNTDS